jgi:DNA-binding transcriptional LysR family regulator
MIGSVIPMELRDLRAFVAVVEHTGFTRAAERLHLVQSSVSDAVRRLEREFGVRLVERDRHGVRPSPAGERLLPWAKLMLNSADQAAADIADFTQLTGGTVRFGMLPTLTPLVLPALLAEIYARFPALEVRVEEGLAPALVERLATGDLDIVVLFFPTDRNDGLTFVEIGEVPLSVLTAPTHWLGPRHSVALSQLSEERWVSFPPNNPGRLWLEDACRLAGFTPAVAAVVESPVQQRTFVEAGYGVALVPFGAASWWQPLRSVPLVPPFAEPRVGYAYNADQPDRSLAPIREILARVTAGSGINDKAAGS